MSKCQLVSVDVIDPGAGHVTVEVLGTNDGCLELEIQSNPAFVDLLIGGVVGAGNAGPPGPEGPQGAEGLQGSTGADGALGPGGSTEQQGQMGLDGAQGPRGPSGPTGPAGPEGPQGPKGDDGGIGGGSGIDLETVTGVAAGSTLGLQQQLLADAGQPAKTVLAVGYTNTGKVQGCSLGAGNVVTVFTNGDDFTAGDVLYREFLGFGEPICFAGLAAGAIITSTQSF
jgi:hypothetical protein